MNINIEKISAFGKQMLKNAIPFLVTLIFIGVFGKIFGSENTLLAVAIGVGLTMLPLCDLSIKPLPATIIIFSLYVLSAVVGQFALLSPWLAFFVNFSFLFLILLLSSEPAIMKPSISFLLCFIFCQSTPVSWSAFPNRLLCSVVGSLIVIVVSLLFWHKKGYGKEGRTLKEQVLLCNHDHRYMFRMAFGVSFAMLIGMLCHLVKPLWVSIVVMSLTQVDWEDTKMRMKYRFVGTLLGILLFFFLFQYLIPQSSALYVIMLLGYLGAFTNEYKYKQAINAVSALNASLVLLDTKTAVVDRILFFFLGAMIVLVLYFVAEGIKKGKDLWLKHRNESSLKEKYA